MCFSRNLIHRIVKENSCTFFYETAPENMEPVTGDSDSHHDIPRDDFMALDSEENLAFTWRIISVFGGVVF